MDVTQTTKYINPTLTYIVTNESGIWLKCNGMGLGIRENRFVDKLEEDAVQETGDLVAVIGQDDFLRFC